MALPKLTPFSIEAVRANSVIDENGCWIWQGSFRGKGYAQCSVYWHHSRMEVVRFGRICVKNRRRKFVILATTPLV
jgi:hypothetical protein